MASPTGSRSSSPDRREQSGDYECADRPNLESVSTVYEELFDDDGGNGRPCYLPDEIQAEDSNRFVASENLDAANGERWKISSKNQKHGGRSEKSNGVHTMSEKLDKGEHTSVSGSDISGPENGGDSPSEDKVRAELDTNQQSEVIDGDSYSDQGQETPPSPSSSHGGTSGYLAGSGSSTVSGVSVTEESAEQLLGQESQQQSAHIKRMNWVPGKRHADEDDTSSSWRRHKKHFFILSNAGKPIYSRYGDENKLAGFSATLQAIMSFVENSGDRIHMVRAGDHQIIFLVKGPLYLVSISATDEPSQMIKGQLELLHGQVLLILTKAVEKCFVKNAKFDMRPLLGGTEVVFSSLIHAFSWNPATFLHAYTCLPLPYAARQAAGAALQDMPESGALFGLLMCGDKVISVVGPRKGSLHPDDILLLSNFVSSSESFRTTESFSPVCLPGYNAAAFLYAYVQYLDKDVCLILLTADSEAFFHLKECRAHIEILLRESDVLRKVSNSVQRGDLRVEDLPDGSSSSLLDLKTHNTLQSVVEHDLPGLVGEARQGALVQCGGPGGLLHFMYRSSYLDQYVASAFSPPLHTPTAQKRVFREYQKLHASMHAVGVTEPHKMQYRRDQHHVLLSWRTSDFELYAAFDPLAEKGSAVAICNRVCQWLRDVESGIFLLGATPFNW